MSVSREELEESRLELEEKILKIANLQADTTLKQIETRTEPWKVVVGGVAAGGALVGAAGAAGALLARSLGH